MEEEEEEGCGRPHQKEGKVLLKASSHSAPPPLLSPPLHPFILQMRPLPPSFFLPPVPPLPLPSSTAHNRVERKRERELLNFLPKKRRKSFVWLSYTPSSSSFYSRKKNTARQRGEGERSAQLATLPSLLLPFSSSLSSPHPSDFMQKLALSKRTMSLTKSKKKKAAAA